MCVTCSGSCVLNPSAEVEEGIYDVPVSCRRSDEHQGETLFGIVEISEHLLLFGNVL